MKSLKSSEEQQRSVLMQLAGLVNTLSLDKRILIRARLGDYTHDLKHLLGIITNAHALLKRYSESDASELSLSEVIQVIGEATQQIDHQIDLLAESLNHEILIDE